MFTWTTTCAATIGCAVVICIGRHLKNSRHKSRRYPLPPGPPGIPWVGNVLGIDGSAPWLTYAEWAKRYGDLVYSRLLGKDIIIISSEKGAKELLEHRSRNNSDRPYLITNDLCGTDFNSGLLLYGDRWRLHRRFFNQTFRNDAVSRFRPLQHRKSCILLQQLLDTPGQFSEHVFDYTTSVIMNSAYGYDPAPGGDELTKAVANVVEIIRATIRPEVALIVGALPILLHLPSWFPGFSFKSKMAIARELANQYVERPFEYSLRKELDDTFTPSMVHDSVRRSGLGDGVTDDTWMKELKGAAATAFLAGAETTNAVIVSFFLAMVLNPEVQEKAQAQVDLVLGGDRLPTLDDRPSLPYVDAILRELYRLYTTIPLSLPHSAMDDDVYRGFHIPKGALLVTNLWSMAHDETKYPNPHKFIPERFLDENGSLLPNDTENIVFGFGRRICPGRHFADTSIWSAISCVLAAFHISKSQDANGMEIPVEPKFTGGVTTGPLPFVCSIVPRAPEMDAQKLEQMIVERTA